MRRDTDISGICLVSDPSDYPAYRKHLADCVILCADGRLFFQRHSDNDRNAPGAIHPFGGHVEDGEIPEQAMVWEISEETGGTVENAIFLGAVTEEGTGYNDLVHVWFWHDASNTVTGCYERESIHFGMADAVLAYPKLMDYGKWAILECLRRNLLMTPSISPDGAT